MAKNEYETHSDHLFSLDVYNLFTITIISTIIVDYKCPLQGSFTMNLFMPGIICVINYSGSLGGNQVEISFRTTKTTTINNCSSKNKTKHETVEFRMAIVEIARVKLVGGGV